MDVEGFLRWMVSSFCNSDFVEHTLGVFYVNIIMDKNNDRGVVYFVWYACDRHLVD